MPPRHVHHRDPSPNILPSCCFESLQSSLYLPADALIIRRSIAPRILYNDVLVNIIDAKKLCCTHPIIIIQENKCSIETSNDFGRFTSSFELLWNKLINRTPWDM
jgi:hypothetical protein